MPLITWARPGAGHTLGTGSGTLTNEQHGSTSIVRGNRLNSSSYDAGASRCSSIAIVCALRLEYNALAAALDSPPQVLPHDVNDPFIYTTGVLSGRDVIISFPPATGPRDTALAVQFLEQKYGKMRLLILLGICAGIPKPPRRTEIFLGDVIISTAVLAYAHGARMNPDRLELRESVASEAGGTMRQMLELIGTDPFSLQLADKSRRLLDKLRDKPQYRSPPESKDLLFSQSYHHLHRSSCPDNLCDDEVLTICDRAKEASCQLLQCDEIRARRRLPYAQQPFSIHCGPFASADLIMRDGRVRDGLAEKHGILAFDMEATGIWGLSPHVVVIKGVCDYGDSHKNKEWQNFAAAHAACAAIAFISTFSPEEQFENRDDETMLSKDQNEAVSTTAPPTAELMAAMDAIRNMDLPDAEYKADLPMDGTCEWIFKNPEFLAWINPDAESVLLCIKGSLGSGKSTLMRHLVSSLKKSPPSTPNRNIAAFFIGSPRDDESYNTPTEIYRSLFVQILRNHSRYHGVSEFLDKRRSKAMLSQGANLDHRELRQSLKQLLASRRLEPTLILIDDVGKCTDPDELVRFFQDISSTAPSANPKICFTSQQTFPIIDSECSFITMEDFNHQDIVTYIEKRFPNVGFESQATRVILQPSIEEKASGSFLWIVLVINLLRGHLNRGRDVAFLCALLDETPHELAELYRSIIIQFKHINGPEETRTAIHVMQWILLSARPLTLAEWHHVFALIDNPSLRSIAEWESSTTYTESDQLLLKRIECACYGLVCVKDRQVPHNPLGTLSETNSLGPGAGSFASHQYIDVVHSSVRKFFIDGGGFTLLDPQIQNPIGSGHAYIMGVCIQYCFLEEMLEAFKLEHEDEKEEAPLIMPSAGPSKSPPSKLQVLRRLRTKMGNLARQTRQKRGPKASETRDLPAQIKGKGPDLPKLSSKTSALKRRIRVPRDDGDDEVSDTMSLGSSAGVALRWSRSNSSDTSCRPSHKLKALALPGAIKSAGASLTRVDHGSEESLNFKAVSDYLDGVEPPTTEGYFDDLSYFNSETSAGTTLSQYKVVEDPPCLWQYCQNMLSYHAIATEREGIVPEVALEFLLSRNNENLVATWKEMRYGATQDYFAAQMNLVSWLKYFGSQRPPNPVGGQLRYPIIVAAKLDNLAAFEYLLGKKPWLDLLCSDSRDRTALHHAAMSPQSSVLLSIHQLHEVEPEIVDEFFLNSRDNQGRTALHLAALHGLAENVEQLLSMGTCANSRDKYMNTPLHLSCLSEEPNHRICEMLVKAGCDHCSDNTGGKTALQLAQDHGHSQIADYLATLDSAYRPHHDNYSHYYRISNHFERIPTQMHPYCLAGYISNDSIVLEFPDLASQQLPTAHSEQPRSQSWLRSWLFCC